jgi:GT2 family glycosyltransferase
LSKEGKVICSPSPLRLRSVQVQSSPFKGEEQEGIRFLREIVMIITSIIIVTYNSEREISECLDSVLPQCGAETEIIVVDNGSSDRTMQMLQRYRKSVEIVKSPSNLGFAKGNNIGFRQARGKYVLLLNPDTVVPNGIIAKMADFMELHKEVTILAPLIRNPDGSPQQSVRRFPDYRILFFELLGLARLFPRSRICNRWRIPEFDFSVVQEVAQPMAAALLIRKEWFGRMFMDGRFVMFFNDVDLCKRVWDGGGKIVFYPEATIVHARGASTAKVGERMIPLHTRGFIQYFQKHSCSWFERLLLCLYMPVLVFNTILRIFLLRVFGIDF